MKEFRTELLELLISHYGEFISINYLTDKYCGEGSLYTEGKCKKRLSANLVLRELAGMNWINLYPDGGLSTAHAYNQNSSLREFIQDEPIKARLTTYGEVEYKKTKQDNASQVHNVQNIRTNYGIAAQSSDLKNLQAAFHPIATPQIVQNIATPKQGIITSIGKWVLDNIIGVIIAGLILGFLIYILGWNK